MGRSGVRIEKLNSLKDAAYYLEERGFDIVILDNDESTINRDVYNSIKKRTPVKITIPAFPVVFSPTEDELKEAGIREKVDVLVTLATKHLKDRDLTYSKLDTIR